MSSTSYMNIFDDCFISAYLLPITACYHINSSEVFCMTLERAKEGGIL